MAGKGLPEANRTRPAVASQACWKVHSAFDVGFERGNMMGRSFSSAIACAITCSFPQRPGLSNHPALPHSAKLPPPVLLRAHNTSCIAFGRTTPPVLLSGAQHLLYCFGVPRHAVRVQRSEQGHGSSFCEPLYPSPLQGLSSGPCSCRSRDMNELVRPCTHQGGSGR